MSRYSLLPPPTVRAITPTCGRPFICYAAEKSPSISTRASFASLSGKRSKMYQDLLERARRGIWPLISFAKGGKRPEVVDTVLTRFASTLNETTRELLSLTALFASLAFTDLVDRQWLERRLAMLEDILSEAPLYKSLMHKGKKKDSRKDVKRDGYFLHSTP
jgi:hypothetical protein